MCLVPQSCLTLRLYGLQPTRLLCPWDSLDKSTVVDCHALLQEIFPTLGSNPGLLYCRQTLYPLSHQGSKSINMIHLLCIYGEAKFPSNTSYLVYREDVLFCSSTWAHLICLVGEKKPQFNLEHCIKCYSTPAVMDILCSHIPILSYTTLFYAPTVQSSLVLWLLLALGNERNQLKMRSVKEIISKILFKSIPSLKD